MATRNSKPPLSGLIPWTTADLSKVLGISTNRIGQLVASGVLVRSGRGRFDPVASVNAYLRYKIGTFDVRLQRTDTPRNRLANAKAAVAEMEISRLRATYIPVRSIQGAYDGVARVVRERVALVPDRFLARVADFSDPIAARHILSEEISDALMELSQTGVTPTQR